MYKDSWDSAKPLLNMMWHRSLLCLFRANQYADGISNGDQMMSSQTLAAVIKIFFRQTRLSLNFANYEPAI